MKRHLSVIMLAARLALVPALCVSALGAAASVLLMDSALGSGLELANGGVFDAARPAIDAGAAVLWALLIIPLRERGGAQPGYTLRRLSVSEKTVVLWQTAVYAVAFFMFMMAQAAAMLLFGFWAQSRGYGAAGELSTLTGFVLSRSAHVLLPMGNVWAYMRMGLVYLALGASAAYSSFFGRRGKFAVSSVVVTALVLLVSALRGSALDSGVDAVYMAGAAISLLCFGVSVKARCDAEDQDGTGG